MKSVDKATMVSGMQEIMREGTLKVDGGFIVPVRTPFLVIVGRTADGHEIHEPAGAVTHFSFITDVQARRLLTST